MKNSTNVRREKLSEITIFLPTKLIRKVEKVANELGMTTDAFISFAIKEYLDSYEKIKRGE